MKSKSLKGITSSLRVNVVPIVDAGPLVGVASSGRCAVSILWLHYCGIPGIG